MKPFATTFDLQSGTLLPNHEHIVRRLSSMQGQYLDQRDFQNMLAEEDRVLYEVYQNNVPPRPGELLHGTSIVHPGKVGDEYFMTKGHFHNVLETAEVYLCVKGHGFMMMENPEGEWATEELVPGSVLYVPPRWAHRAINVGDEDLVLFFSYPANAGHDYRTIEEKGFRKLMLERGGRPTIVDNPRWQGSI